MEPSSCLVLQLSEVTLLSIVNCVVSFVTVSNIAALRADIFVSCHSDLGNLSAAAETEDVCAHVSELPVIVFHLLEYSF